MEHRLKWLGHVGRMDEGRLPKKLLFGELRKTRPNHGTKRRWRDLVSQDLKSIGAKDTWYKTCQDRKGWLDVCQEVVDKAAENRSENRCAANIPSQGKVTHVIVGECFDDQVTLRGIKDFARNHQPVNCRLPKMIIQGLRYHSKPTMGGFKVQGSRCVCVLLHVHYYAKSFTFRSISCSEYKVVIRYLADTTQFLG